MSAETFNAYVYLVDRQQRLGQPGE